MPREKSEAQLERIYQGALIRLIKSEFPGCVVIKNDSGYLQGFPDLTILMNDRWAVLEVKASATAEHQPNQDYYIEKLNAMAFAAFIYPENQEEVLDGLEQALCDSRSARVLER